VVMECHPAPAGFGIQFRRRDIPDAPCIPATRAMVVEAELTRRTTLSNGHATVHTVEHLLSAAYALGVDNLLVELDAPEPPFLDGSALPYAEALGDVGMTEQDATISVLTVSSPTTYVLPEAEFSVLPSSELRVTFFFTSDEPLLRNQCATFVVTPDDYLREIAPARTFAFFHEIEALRAAGLIRGGSLASAVVIGRKSILNESLRFPDEPVRHKILDFIGDLALVGTPLTGHFLVWRGGHRVNAMFVEFLRKELAL